MAQAKLRWTAVGCAAPWSEAVSSRLGDRQVLAAADDGEARDLVVVLCDDATRWDTLAAASSDGDVVTVAVLPELAIDGYTRALSLGAAGVVYVDTASSITADVIVAASQGEVLLPSQAAHAMARAAHRERPSTDLDATDLQLLRALSDGTTVVGMASRLHYIERTVRRYLQNLYLRMGVRNRAEAIAVAGKLGLLDS